jgi:hypothetical protein
MLLVYKLILSLTFSSDIAALSADDFADREAAEARLGCRIDLTWPLLDRRFRCPERDRRARRIMSRVLPSSPPPLAVLSGKPLCEWETSVSASPGYYRRQVGGYPGPEWHLAWIKPSWYGQHGIHQARDPVSFLVWLYGERARTQWVWTDWQSTSDSREGTRLLCHDLLHLGVPPCILRRLLDWMADREEALYSGAYQ